MLSNYDAKTNTFYKPAAEKVKSRAFIVTIADNQEEAEAIQRGEHNKFNLSPILAPIEQVALEHITSNGKIALSIVPLELLEMQVNLLYDLAKQQNVEISRENIFKVV